jgi:hypothetical protein
MLEMGGIMAENENGGGKIVDGKNHFIGQKTTIKILNGKGKRNRSFSRSATHSRFRSSMRASEWGTKNSPAFGDSLAGKEMFCSEKIVTESGRGGGEGRGLTVGVAELAEQFALPVEFHHPTVAVTVGHEEFAAAGHGHVGGLAEVLVVRAINFIIKLLNNIMFLAYDI